jgi:hypothetical protein
MAAWNSSSLGFSDLNGGRHSSGLMKNLTERLSKQHLTEHRMFGSKRGKIGKDLKIGKKFKGVGKGTTKSLSSSDKSVSPKGGGISPSIEEFDKMMSKISGKSSKGFGEKKMFSRKSFG